jgi:hypothetical protein
VLDLGGGAYGLVDHDSGDWARVEGDTVVEAAPNASGPQWSAKWPSSAIAAATA